MPIENTPPVRNRSHGLRPAGLLLAALFFLAPCVPAGRAQAPQAGHAAAPRVPDAPFQRQPEDPLTIHRLYPQPVAEATPDSPEAPPPPGPVFVLVKSTTEIHGPVRRELLYYRGRPEPVVGWIVGDLLVGQHPLDPAAVRMDGRGATENSRDVARVFPEIFWVNKGNFAGWEEIGGALCRVHSANVPPTILSDGSVNSFMVNGEATAWISDATRMPVRVVYSGGTVEFSYGPGPEKRIELPAAYRALLKARQLGAAGRLR